MEDIKNTDGNERIVLMKEFDEASRPLREFLKKYGDDKLKVIVTRYTVELVEKVVGITEYAENWEPKKIN